MCVHVCVCERERECVSVHVCVCMHVCVHAHMFVCMYVCVCDHEGLWGEPHVRECLAGSHSSLGESGACHVCVCVLDVGVDEHVVWCVFVDVCL